MYKYVDCVMICCTAEKGSKIISSNLVPRESEQFLVVFCLSFIYKAMYNIS